MFKIQHVGTGEIFYATPYSAGFDIPANNDGTLAPWSRTLVPTGLYATQGDEEYEMVEKGNKGKKYRALPELQIRSRSGQANKAGVIVLNAPGTIDFDYLKPFEIKVLLINLSDDPFTWKAGDRIAQGVVEMCMQLPDIPIKDATRKGGFGSTGVSSDGTK